MSRSSMIRQIPKPEEIRQRLSEAVREASALRRLLKLSLSIHRDRERQGVAHGG